MKSGTCGRMGETAMLVPCNPRLMDLKGERTRPACLLSRPGEDLHTLTFPEPNSPARSVG